MSMNVGGNNNAKGNNKTSGISAEKANQAKELNFKKLQLNSLFSIEDNDKDGKVGLNDITGKKTKSVIKLLLPYLSKPTEWTQEIIDNLSNAIKSLNKKSIEQEQEVDLNNWTEITQEGNSKTWVKGNNDVAVDHSTSDGYLVEYNNGQKTIGTLYQTQEVTDVEYDDKTKRITQFTDANGVTTNNSVDENGNSVRTFKKDGQPITVSAAVLGKDKGNIDNISSIEFDANGNLKSYTVASNEFEGDLKYDSKGKLIGFIDKDGKQYSVKQTTCKEYNEISILDKQGKTIKCFRDIISDDVPDMIAKYTYNDKGQRVRIDVDYKKGGKFDGKTDRILITRYNDNGDKMYNIENGRPYEIKTYGGWTSDENARIDKENKVVDEAIKKCNNIIKNSKIDREGAKKLGLEGNRSYDLSKPDDVKTILNELETIRDHNNQIESMKVDAIIGAIQKYTGTLFDE